MADPIQLIISTRGDAIVHYWDSAKSETLCGKQALYLEVYKGIPARKYCHPCFLQLRKMEANDG